MICITGDMWRVGHQGLAQKLKYEYKGKYKYKYKETIQDLHDIYMWRVGHQGLAQKLK